MVNFDSDTEIMKHTRREGEADYTKFVFPSNLVPFDNPIVAHIDKVEASSVTEWCNLVRGKIRAWEKSQNAEERGPAPTPPPADGGEATAVRHSGGRPPAVQGAVQAVKDEMEEYILQSLRACEAEIEALERERDAIEERLEFLYVQFHRVSQAHKAYATEVEDGDSTSGDDDPKAASSPEVHNPVG